MRINKGSICRKSGQSAIERAEASLANQRTLRYPDKVKSGFVSIQTEFEIESKRMINSEIGIDMGVKKFVTFSNRTFVEPVNSLKNNLKQLAKLQKELSRQQKGRNNSKKTKAKNHKTAQTHSEYKKRLSRIRSRRQ